MTSGPSRRTTSSRRTGWCKEALLDRLAAPPAVDRVRGELGAEEAADLYDAALEDVTLELALNGIGPDGHTASLFPGAPTLDERDRRAIAAEPRLEPFVPRVTMTPPMFAAAALLVYLVTGEGKAEAVPPRLRRRSDRPDAGQLDPRRQDDRDPRRRRSRAVARFQKLVRLS